MSRNLKLHLDENVSNAITISLRRYEINVTTTIEIDEARKLADFFRVDISLFL